MPHIHTKPGQHDLTSTAFIIRMTYDGPKVFLHKHRKLGILLPVGGHVELDETPWAAILHELREESGYDPDQLKILQPKERILRMTDVKTHPVPLFLQTHRFDATSQHSHIDLGFAFLADELPRNPPAEGETQEILWLSREEVQLRKHEMPADISEIYEFVFTHAMTNWERVLTDVYDV